MAFRHSAERIREMSITLTFSHIETGDGTCVPVRFYESQVSCRNGMEKIASAIQLACVETAKRVLEEMREKGGAQ